MDNNQFNNNNQPVMNNESKKKGNSGLVILLLILLLAAVGYIGYDKFYASKQNSNNGSKEVEDNNVVENNDNQETNNEIKSYLIYDNSTGQKLMVDSSHGISVVYEEIDDMSKCGNGEYTDWCFRYIIRYNNKNIYTLTSYVGIKALNRLYLIGDILLYTWSGNDITGSIGFIDLNGNELDSGIDYNVINKEKTPFGYLFYEITVDNNNIYIPLINGDTSGEGGCYSWKKDYAGIEIYKIEYLGNHQFSNIEKVMSKTRSCN